jgi:hypothetical protein
VTSILDDSGCADDAGTMVSTDDKVLILIENAERHNLKCFDSSRARDVASMVGKFEILNGLAQEPCGPLANNLDTKHEIVEIVISSAVIAPVTPSFWGILDDHGSTIVPGVHHSIPSIPDVLDSAFALFCPHFQQNLDWRSILPQDN